MLRSTFILLSQNRHLRRFSERSPIGRKLSRRFVAGTSVDEALRACEEVNREGMSASLDSLGESVTDTAQALQSAEVYHQLLEQIQHRGLQAHVSLKLTQMGLDLDPATAERLVCEIVQRAAAADSFVRIDMEGSAYTEATIQMTERIHAEIGLAGRVGTVLQAYLHRTEPDTERLLRQGIRIRLCKGAYKEPREIAFARKQDVDTNYIRLMERMVRSDDPHVFCGIATHDERIVNHMRALAAQEDIAKNAFEFQMLYGIRRDLQRKLVSEGFGVRIYIPFGTEWFPYFMRRLAERPANVFFLLKNFFRT